MPIRPRARHALCLAPLLLLTACPGNTGQSAITPAQVVTDLTGALTALSTIEHLIVTTNPKAIPPDQQAKIEADLAQAQAALATLTANLPATTGASTAETIDRYINAAVTTLATLSANVPGLSTFSPEINIIASILPATEAFINQYLPASMTQLPTVSKGAFRQLVVGPHYSVEQARARLHVPVVR